MTDIRQIIRLACNHGVTLVVHGVKVIGSSHNDAAPAAQKKTSTPARDESVQQSTDPVACKPLSKKAQRDASRLQEYQEKLRLAPILSRWERLTRQSLRMIRRIACHEVWSTWRKEVLRRKVLRKLRSLLWQAWTQPTKECKESLSLYALTDPHANQTQLEACSPRDRYILNRVRALCRRARVLLVSEERRPFLHWKNRTPARRASPDDSDMESVPSLEEETEPSEPESGSSDDESHDVNHADNRLASAQRSCLEAGVKHVSTPPIKGGSKTGRLKYVLHVLVEVAVAADHHLTAVATSGDSDISASSPRAHVSGGRGSAFGFGRLSKCFDFSSGSPASAHGACQ